jgi:hypothetical protein
MARPLVLQFGGKDLPFQIEKVARDDLYGYVEIETVDDKGRPCRAAKLASDGRSIILSGGTAVGCISSTGDWLERKSLTPVDADNQPITPVTSSFSAPVALEETVTIDEFLSHNIVSVYQITCETDFGDLTKELQAGKIFRFPFSFRGGLEADAAFLLQSADGTPFLMIGHATKFEFVGFEQPTGIDNPFDEGEPEDESLDFSMM